MNWRFTSGLILGAALALAAGVAAPRKQPLDPTDPETILRLAQQEMREAQAKNREHAVQAITQKNVLQAECDKIARIMRNLAAREAVHREAGDHEQADALAAEREKMQASEASLLDSLQQATEATEQIKHKIRQEEQRIRAKTAQAMALRTEMRQARIERDLELSYLGRVTVDVERSFADARKKLDTARARNAFLKQIRLSTDQLQTEADHARESGDDGLARRLQTLRDALAESAVNAFRSEAP